MYRHGVFFSNKNLAVGEGGMGVTRDPALYQKIKSTSPQKPVHQRPRTHPSALPHHHRCRSRPRMRLAKEEFAIDYFVSRKDVDDLKQERIS